MHDVQMRNRSIGYLLVGVIAGVCLILGRSTIVEQLARRENSTITTRVAVVAHDVSNTVPNDGEGLYHVTYKDHHDDYIQGSVLTVEEGTYVITDTSRGVPETVAVYPMASVESIAAVSHENR